jgi:hypothetical protein
MQLGNEQHIIQQSLLSLIYYNSDVIADKPCHYKSVHVENLVTTLKLANYKQNKNIAKYAVK